jgi:hypothetical protein
VAALVTAHHSDGSGVVRVIRKHDMRVPALIVVSAHALASLKKGAPIVVRTNRLVNQSWPVFQHPASTRRGPDR